MTIGLREVDTADAIGQLPDGTLGLAFVCLDAIDPPMAMLPLREDDFVAALPDGHPLVKSVSVELRDLANEPFVFFQRKQSPRFYDSVIEACLSAGFSPQVAHESTSIRSQVGLVACGLAVALVPRSIGRMQCPAWCTATSSNPSP